MFIQTHPFPPSGAGWFSCGRLTDGLTHNFVTNWRSCVAIVAFITSLFWQRPGKLADVKRRKAYLLHFMPIL